MNALYHRLLERFSVWRKYPLTTRLTAVSGCDASSRRTSEPICDGALCVGDACMTVDPLASQGVHLAMGGALQAAAVVNTLLRHPADRDAALSFYRARQIEKSARFCDKTAEMYRRVAAVREHSFWRDRAGAAHDPAPLAKPRLPARYRLVEREVDLV